MGRRGGCAYRGSEKTKTVRHLVIARVIVTYNYRERVTSSMFLFNPCNPRRAIFRFLVLFLILMSILSEWRSRSRACRDRGVSEDVDECDKSFLARVCVSACVTVVRARVCPKGEHESDHCTVIFSSPFRFFCVHYIRET